MWLIGVNYILKNYQINISAIHWGVVPLTSSIAGYLAFSVKLSAIKKVSGGNMILILEVFSDNLECLNTHG